MAGIGFALRRLTQQDDLGGLAAAYTHAALVSSGPWLFTIVALAGIDILAPRFVDLDALALFRIILIYNFAFSLVIAGPITMIANRFLADRLFLKEADAAPGMLLGALGLLFAVEALVAIPLYGFEAELDAPMRVIAIIGFFVSGGIWLVSVFLTALKSFGSVSRIFAFGMVGAFVASLGLAAPYGATGLLAGFTLGLALIFFALIARIFIEYPYRPVRPFAFLGYFLRYWELALAGFFYNLAIWADKWVMWFAPEGNIRAGILMSYPDYDGAMFLAYLSIVPAMALFMISLETRFYEEYLRFYRDLLGHAPYGQIVDNHGRMMRLLAASFRNIALMQTVICYLIAVLAPLLLDALGASIRELGIFRFGVLGALFHALMLFATVILAYFDLRRLVLLVYTVFLVANFGFTWLTREMGYAYYGYGYFLASLLGLILAYGLAVRSVSRLPYLTFVANNPSLRPVASATP
jgi:polysaccharide biosynthesis protein PelG